MARLFYRRQASREMILETLALLAERGAYQQHCAQRDQGRHILVWLHTAARQAATVEEVLLKEYRKSSVARWLVGVCRSQRV